jgi:hypothetical protein
MSVHWTPIIVSTVLIAGAVAVNQTEVKVNCGPQVTTIPAVRGLEYTGIAGTFLHDISQTGKQPSYAQIHKTVMGGIGIIDMWRQDFVAHVKYGANAPETPLSAAWQSTGQASYEAALASCCPTLATVPVEQPGTPPQSGGGTVQPASLSTTKELSGAELAADALSRAGFPKKWIAMFIAIAKHESSFNPKAVGPTVGAGTMRGMWQLNDQYWKIPNWQDPYANARKALEVARDSVANGRSPYYPWSTRHSAQSDAPQYENLVPNQPGVRVEQLPNAMQADPNDPVPNPTDCAQPPTGDPGLGTATGDINGTVREVISLNPSGAGNFQTMAKDGPYWYVAKATTGNNAAVVHQLNGAGQQVSEMRVRGEMHPTGIGVRKGIVYADVSDTVVSFPYRGGTTIDGGSQSKTGWHGEISIDPHADRAVIRRGNKYRLYDMATKKEIGVQIKTAPGMRQGFGVSGKILTILSGKTNGPASMETWSFTTGKRIGIRDVTDVGFRKGEKKGNREPEGVFGNMIGVKVFTGDKRRLRVFEIGSKGTPSLAKATLKGGPPAGWPIRSDNMAPNTARGRELVMKHFPIKVRVADCAIQKSGHVANSFHYTGHACDIMTGSRKQLGFDISRWARANARQLGVEQVIHNNQIWTLDRSGDGWRPYSGASNHEGHVHLSFNRDKGTQA